MLFTYLSLPSKFSLKHQMPSSIILQLFSLHLHRFPEVAKLLEVWWFDIYGMINTIQLSPNTQYAAYFVFQMINASGFRDLPVELSVGVKGGRNSTKIVCLDSNMEGWQYHTVGLQRPNVRSDGWLEIEMGEFFNSGLEVEEVQMNVKELRKLKKGIFIEGIEVRPK
ncbi:F-box protein PP2-B10-like isoform X2 [Trifolium pratense]|uniref:F-box protein PP2-B10-like isoform X2 n=1 Tax=Trifolium pratense TaxID=57577 RepID=UPI001E6936A4|nr:F-box protein PP2-B10-like isoform X2 [Trifolium pratense]XP_045809088.1 F-box protein PP2-B10-like isoform X2 [Trifolium pratense]